MFLVNKLSKAHKIDLFIGPSHVLPFNKLRGVKYILVVHDLFFLTYPYLVSKTYMYYSLVNFKRSLKNADIIISDSESTKQDILKFYNLPKEKIKTIHLGVDPIFIKARSKKRLIQSKYILSLTTQPTRKNIESVLKAIQLSKLLKNYKLVIAGLINEKQLGFLKDKIQKMRLSRQVIIFGYARQKDLISLYQNAEVFIYPSLYEGFGLPVLEAMISKTPVIAANIGSLHEIISNKQWLVNPYDFKLLAKKMEKILKLNNKKKKELIKSNYEHAGKFNYDKTAKAYLKIINMLYEKNLV